MQVGSFVNKSTGETFKSNIFTDQDGNRIFVPFSQELGELSPSEISQRKDKLEVVMLEDGAYLLQEKHHSEA